MPFNINSFKQNGLVYGGARPSLFDVFMTVPAGIGIDNVSVDKSRFVCRGASLPASSVASIDAPYFGRKIKLAGDRTFADWTVTVMNDEDFGVRSMFEVWSNGLNRMVSNVRDPSLSMEQYKTDFDIVQYGKDGTVIRSYQMVGAFPTEVGEIQLDWDSTNTIEVFTVNFAFDYWVPLVESSGKKAGGINTYAAAAEQDGPAGPG